MFLTSQSQNYNEQVAQLINTSKKISMAIAFWGHDSVERIEGALNKGKVIRIICNLEMGGTNPDAIESLLKLQNGDNFKILQNDTLHAKVFIGDTQAIVGSANFSANGLGFEDEEITENNGTAKWEEAGILTDDKSMMVSVSNWFENTWGKAITITPDDIKQAKQIWDTRRKERYTSTDWVKNLNISELQGRNIHIVVVNQEHDEEQITCDKKIRAEEPQLFDSRGNSIGFYGGWPKLSQECTLICFSCSYKNDFVTEGNLILESEGVWKRIKNGERKDGKTSIQYVEKIDKIMLRPFKDSDQKKLMKKLKKAIHIKIKEKFGAKLKDKKFSEVNISFDSDIVELIQS